MGTANFTIGHFSDTHLGYEAYPGLSASGNNQRGEDMVRAMRNVAEDIRAFDPPLVIHAGDVTERPKVDIRYMLVAQQLFTRLAEIRPDGSRRQVVIVAGNHEQPRSRKEVCWLELMSSIPGVTVVANSYQVLRFIGGQNDVPAELDGVAVHCLPHDTLKEIDFTTVVPDPSASANILVAHGVAMGSELFTRAIGREYPIDGDMLARDWDYGALGHFHKRGPVSSGRRQGMDRVWYSGSPEHVSFRDLKDNNAGKGYLRVKLQGPALEVTPVDLPIRSMFRLPVIDATGKSAEQITEQMRANLASANLTGAVVGQIVEGVTRDMWSLIDISSVRKAAKDALHYEVSARYGQAEKIQGEVGQGGGLGDLALILDEQIAVTTPVVIAEDVKRLATKLLGSVMAAGIEAPSDESSTEASGEPVAEDSAQEPLIDSVLEGVAELVTDEAAEPAPALKRAPAKKAATKKAGATKTKTAAAKKAAGTTTTKTTDEEMGA